MCRPNKNNDLKRNSSSITNVSTWMMRITVLALVVVSLYSENKFSKLYGEVATTTTGHNSDAERQLVDVTEVGNTLAQVHAAEATAAPQTPQLPTAHIIFALCGNHPDFFREFSVALKSVLLNAPHDRDLNIHLMTNWKAYEYLPTVWNEIQINGAPWWRNITIIPYNVEPMVSEWGKILKEGTGLGKKNKHTFGTYYRLFAHKVLPPDIEYAFYLDTDVAIVNNLAHAFGPETLPQEDTPENPSPLFIMSNECAGVMMVNVRKLPQFWEHVKAIPWGEKGRGVGLAHADQSMVLGVGKEYPGTVKTISKPWDFSTGANFNKARFRDRLINFRPEPGLFHYNGAGGSKLAFFDSTFVNKRPDGIGLHAIYYRDLPWPWAKFSGRSVGQPDPYTQIRVQGRDADDVPPPEPTEDDNEDENDNDPPLPCEEGGPCEGDKPKEEEAQPEEENKPAEEQSPAQEEQPVEAEQPGWEKPAEEQPAEAEQPAEGEEVPAEGEQPTQEEQPAQEEEKPTEEGATGEH